MGLQGVGHNGVTFTSLLYSNNLSVHQWMNEENVVYLYNKILFIHKKNPTISDNMSGFEGIMLSEISKTMKDKYLMILLICGI